MSALREAEAALDESRAAITRMQVWMDGRGCGFVSVLQQLSSLMIVKAATPVLDSLPAQHITLHPPHHTHQAEMHSTRGSAGEEVSRLSAERTELERRLAQVRGGTRTAPHPLQGQSLAGFCLWAASPHTPLSSLPPRFRLKKPLHLHLTLSLNPPVCVHAMYRLRRASRSSTRPRT